MQFPLSFWYISLWLAVTAIVLLATAELASPCYGRTKTTIDTKRLKNVALATGVLSLATFLIQVYQIIVTP